MLFSAENLVGRIYLIATAINVSREIGIDTNFLDVSVDHTDILMEVNNKDSTPSYHQVGLWGTLNDTDIIEFIKI